MFRPTHLLLWLLLWPLTARADLGQPLVDEFNRSAIGAQGLGWSATQLRDGRLVFGFDTIAVYDGVRWSTESMPDTYAVRALDAAEDGGFWAGAVNEVGYFTPVGRGFRYHSLTARLPPELRSQLGDVWHVFSLGPDRALFISTTHLLYWADGHFTVQSLAGAPRLSGFRRGSTVYVGHRPTGLRIFTPATLETALTSAQLHDEGVVWGGRLGAIETYATTSGLRHLVRGELVSFAPEVDAWLAANVLTCATALVDGRLVLGTLKGGSMVVDVDGRAHPLDLDATISTGSVHALFEDREACLWVVCSAGVLRVRPMRAISVIALPRAAAFPVQSVAPLGDGALVASDTGIWRIGGPRTSDASPSYQLTGFRERILSLVRDGDSVLVAHRGGISRIHADDSIDLVHAAPGDVFTAVPAEDGSLAISLADRVLALAPRKIRRVPGTLPDGADSLVRLGPDTFLAGTYAAGVAMLGTPAPAVAAMVHALSAETGRAFVASSDGRLFAARGHTLTALAPDGREPLTFAFSPGVEVKALAAGTNHDAWVACDRHLSDPNGLPVIYHLTIGPGALTPTPLRIDPLHQLGGVTALAAHGSGPATELWIGGESALLRVLPAELPTWTPPSTPELLVVAPALDQAREVHLPYRGHQLDVSILSPEPNRRASLRVQTMLQGTGSVWSYPQDQNNVSLLNLQNGRYALHVRFVAADGGTSGTATLPFTVAPPWWFTSWGLAAQLAVAAAFVYGFMRLRLRNLRARADRLDKLVAERTQQLARASEAKSAFVSNISHELRNPLNGLVASAHALDDARLDEDQRRLLRTVRICADLLDSLIGDVLDMAEIESGTVTLRNQTYNPAEIATTAAGIVRPIAERKGLRVTTAIAPDTPVEAFGDAFRVQQVLLNLLSNALKYSERGEITLAMRRAADGDAKLEYEVTDEGSGMSAEELERLFMKFSRLPSSRERGIPGTGLGLAVCRELVERMGGSIDVRSEIGVGSTFRFSVPIGSPPSQEKVVPPSRTSLPETALVVEDLEYNAEAIVAILGVIACQADTASSGAAALERVRAKRYDVVFIDYDLPDLTGPELAHAILSAGLAVPPRLIAVTAYADDATRVRCRQSGMTGYIVKPITRQKLLAALSDPATAVPAPTESAAAVAGVSNPTLDLRQLELLGGERTGFDAAVQRLAGLLRSDVTLLRDACDAGQLESVRSIAHRIVSHARFVGAQGLALVAGEIERSAREQPELVPDLIPSVEMQAQQVIATLETLPH